MVLCSDVRHFCLLLFRTWLRHKQSFINLANLSPLKAFNLKFYTDISSHPKNYFNIQHSHLLEKLFPFNLTCVSSSRSWTLVVVQMDMKIPHMLRLKWLSPTICWMLRDVIHRRLFEGQIWNFLFWFAEIKLWELLANLMESSLF